VAVVLIYLRCLWDTVFSSYFVLGCPYSTYQPICTDYFQKPFTIKPDERL
jgi:hypothetical protein